MFLREVAHAGFVPPANRAPSTRSGGRTHQLAGRVTNERAKQCGLPYTVAAEQPDFFAAIDVGAETVNHF